MPISLSLSLSLSPPKKNAITDGLTTNMVIDMFFTFSSLVYLTFNVLLQMLIPEGECSVGTQAFGYFWIFLTVFLGPIYPEDNYN